MLLTAADVTPVIPALVMLDASAVAVVPLNVTVVLLIVIVFPLTSVGLVTVPAIVDQLVCHVLPPSNTHALLRFL